METWKPARNFPSYDVSSEGRIKNIRTQRILQPVIDENGVTRVCLRKNNKQYTVKVHRLVAETFLGEQPSLDVRHKDRDRTNNHLDNLEWCTRSELIRDAYRNGSKQAYQRIPVFVRETGKIYNSIKDCAQDLGCDKSSISKCLDGRLNSVNGCHFERADLSHNW